jgi:ABC-type multidrug transport system fused ATPase/permease subunit
MSAATDQTDQTEQTADRGAGSAKQRSATVRGFRIIGRYIRMHPGPFTIAVTGSTVYAAMTVASAVVLGRVTDKVLKPAFSGGVNLSTAWLGAIAVLCVAILRAAGIVTRRYFAGMTYARVCATLRTRIVDRYQELPLAYHRAHPTGELMAHAEADVLAATDVLHPLPYSCAVVMLIVFALVALLLTDPFLAAIGIALLPGLTFLNRFYMKKVEGPARRAQERIGDVSAVAHESIDGALVVKTLGRENSEVARMAGSAGQLRDERIHMGNLRAAFEPAFEALPNLGIVILVGIGAWRVSTGDISEGTLVQFISLFLLLAFPMRLIGFLLSDLPRAVVGFDRVKEVFDERVSMPAPEGAVEPPPGPVGLTAEGVSFTYPDAAAPVIHDLSFDVRPNESVAMVGPTGSGKSTIVMLLDRLADPDSGRITLGGIDLREVSMPALRRDVAVVFQESFLFATSIRENIAMGLELTDAQVRDAARLARVHDFVMSLPNGYETILGERGVTLSGGQRQRVAIARALVRRPRLMIMDDATSAVDPTVEAAILNGLRTELDTTLVIVAYRVSTIALADRVLYLDGGRVVAEGSHLELLSHPDYEAMVRAYERGAA